MENNWDNSIIPDRRESLLKGPRIYFDYLLHILKDHASDVIYMFLTNHDEPAIDNLIWVTIDKLNQAYFNDWKNFLLDNFTRKEEIDEFRALCLSDFKHLTFPAYSSQQSNSLLTMLVEKLWDTGYYFRGSQSEFEKIMFDRLAGRESKFPKVDMATKTQEILTIPLVAKFHIEFSTLIRVFISTISKQVDIDIEKFREELEDHIPRYFNEPAKYSKWLQIMEDEGFIKDSRFTNQRLAKPAFYFLLNNGLLKDIPNSQLIRAFIRTFEIDKSQRAFENPPVRYLDEFTSGRFKSLISS